MYDHYYEPGPYPYSYPSYPQHNVPYNPPAVEYRLCVKKNNIMVLQRYIQPVWVDVPTVYEDASGKLS